MKETGFGIVGTGTIAKVHADSIEATDGARIVGVAGSSPEKARAFAEARNAGWYTDYADMLKDPHVDVVCICTPSGMHAEAAVMAARAGKHLVVEKPLDVTLKAVDSIINECDRAGVRLVSIFQNRFPDGMQALKRVIDEGRLGRLVMGDAYVKWFRTDDYYSSAAWRGTWKLDGGGALMNQGIHYVDLLQWMMGPVESVFGHTSTLTRGIEVEDTAVACLKFKNGAVGVIEACTSAYPGAAARLEIRGERGTVVLEDGNIKEWLVEGEEFKPADDNITGSGSSDPAGISILGHQRQISDLVRAVQEGRPPVIDGREGRKAVELVLAVYESARTGRNIKLPLDT
jgi:UDP-N-acetyl-2-amino-2-deoxyglucuronate dehydrogenase